KDRIRRKLSRSELRGWCSRPLTGSANWSFSSPALRPDKRWRCVWSSPVRVQKCSCHRLRLPSRVRPLAAVLRRLKNLLLDSLAQPRGHGPADRKLLAGVPGFEPGLTVLETAVLAANTIPL